MIGHEEAAPWPYKTLVLFGQFVHDILDSDALGLDNFELHACCSFR